MVFAADALRVYIEDSIVSTSQCETIIDSSLPEDSNSTVCDKKNPVNTLRLPVRHLFRVQSSRTAVGLDK